MINTKEVIKTIIKQHMSDSQSDINLDERTNLISDYEFDSIDIISFFEEIESKFNIKLEPEEMLECIEDVNVLFELIKSKNEASA